MFNGPRGRPLCPLRRPLPRLPPPPPDHRYTSTLNTIVTIAREEGVPMLWKGYLARLSRLGPGYAIQWAVLDIVQKAWAP